MLSEAKVVALLDEKKQEKGRASRFVALPQHIGRQRRPFGAFRALNTVKIRCHPNFSKIALGSTPEINNNYNKKGE